MTLFFDRNMGRKLPEALRLLGLPVEKHDDHFAPTTVDEAWLAVVGKHGWVVVTGDERLLRNRSQVQALADHAVGCFVLCGSGHRDRWYAARIVARNWDRITQLGASADRPFLLRLYLRQPAMPADLPA